jgi:hypothetical protein
MKKFLSLVLALVMTMSLVTISAGAKEFTDADSITYTEAVDVISAIGVVDGYTDGSFGPTTNLNRGQAAKIICNLILGPTTAAALSADTAPFPDVPTNHTFAGYIAYCAKAGIISGYADGTFKPGNTLTSYAFMKMLLGALGYDPAIEGYNEANWSIAVAKQAKNISLDDGLKGELVGTKAVTREEACLFALNTLKADLVEYADKGTSISINGVVLTTGASKPTVVTSNSKPYDTIKDESTGAPSTNYPDTVQFGEKYFSDLSLNSAAQDEFECLANQWKLKGKEIGTYTKEADKTYTTKTSADVIYDDLGLTETTTALHYIDGVRVADFVVKNGDIDNKVGGQGVRTEVYTTTTASTVTVYICEINTYVGDISAKVAATASKAAYVTVAPRGDKGFVGGNFDTTDFALDDIVLYTYSKKPTTGSDVEGVQSIQTAETQTGTLTSFTTDDKAVVGGTTYKYAAKIANDPGTANVNTDVTIVLDQYGNLIDLVNANDNNYAVVLDHSTSGLHKEAKLLFTDGTTKIVSTNGHYAGADGSIVSYVIKSGEEYTLTTVAANHYITTGKNGSVVNSTYTFDNDTNDTAGYTANGKTVFLVRTVNADGDAYYKAYEGIKNVPNITITNAAANTSSFTVYCKTAGNLATVVYVDAEHGVVVDPSSDVVFVKGTNDLSYTSGVGNYYNYSKAILNGELVDSDTGFNASTANQVVKGSYGLFDAVYYDANGVASISATDDVIVGDGVYKQNNEVLGTYSVRTIGDQGNTTANTGNGATVGQNAWYPVADDLKVAMVDADGNLSTGYTISSISRNYKDAIFFKLNSSKEVTYAVIMKDASTLTSDWEDLYSVTLTGPANTYTYTVYNSDGTVRVTDTHTGADPKETISLPAGNFTVKFEATGCATKSVSFRVTSTDGGAATYSAYAVSLTNGVAGMTYTIKDSTGTEVKTTSFTGTSASENLPAGTYSVTFTKSNYATVTKEFTVTAAGGTVAYPENNTLTIDATALNTAHKGTQLLAVYNSSDELVWDSASASANLGSNVTLNVPYGTYTVKYTADNFEDLEKDVAVSSAAAGSYTFTANTDYYGAQFGGIYGAATITLAKTGSSTTAVEYTTPSNTGTSDDVYVYTKTAATGYDYSVVGAGSNRYTSVGTPNADTYTSAVSVENYIISSVAVTAGTTAGCIKLEVSVDSTNGESALLAGQSLRVKIENLDAPQYNTTVTLTSADTYSSATEIARAVGTTGSAIIVVTVELIDADGSTVLQTISGNGSLSLV